MVSYDGRCWQVVICHVSIVSHVMLIWCYVDMVLCYYMRWHIVTLMLTTYCHIDADKLSQVMLKSCERWYGQVTSVSVQMCTKNVTHGRLQTTNVPFFRWQSWLEEQRSDTLGTFLLQLWCFLLSRSIMIRPPSFMVQHCASWCNMELLDATLCISLFI